MEIRIARLTRTIFNRDDFFIVEMQEKGFHKFKAKGAFPSGAVYGQEYELHGEMKVSKYGETFEIKKVAAIVPKDTNGIQAYLVANVPSVGAATAGKIVEVWGDKTIEILTNEPDKLETLGFLKPAQIESIKREWVKADQTRTVSIFLMDLGLGPEMVKHVYGTLGEETIEKVRKNPYCLTKVYRIGFKRADEIALRLGVAPDSLPRVSAALIHCLMTVAPQDGHLYLPESELKEALGELLSIVPKCYDQALQNMLDEGEIVRDEDRLYTRYNYKIEKESAEKIASFVQLASNLGQDLEAFILDYEKSHNMKFSEEQRRAVLSLQDHQLLLVTGLPGTGKTTVVRSFVSFYDNLGIRPLLLAPTGMAAKRLSEVTGWPAQTIHRALGYDGTSWASNCESKLKEKVVIVDEFSMVDQDVFYHLLDALEVDTRLIFVGDAAQLPSVGAGNVLRELGKCPEICRVHLETIHRQAAESDIIVNAHRINKGERIKPKNEAGSDFLFFEIPDADKTIERMLMLIRKLLSKGERFQVLSPMHNGSLGVKNLNTVLREELNPKSGQRDIKIGDKDFREDDKIIVLKNLYSKGVFNGDIGTISQIDKGKALVYISVPGIDLPIEFNAEEAREHLTLAYCITIHKSQGQEYDNVIFPMTEAFHIMLQRNLLYTAVTRGKKTVYIFGTGKAIGRAISNNREESRHTLLSKRVSSILNE